MSNETISGETVEQAVKNLQAAMNGEIEMSSEAVEEAKEKGLNEHQTAVAERYVGEGRVTVDDSTTPNLAQKLAAGAELPWTFVLDGVQFVKKVSGGMGRDPTEWWCYEDGYQFSYYTYKDRKNEISIREYDNGN